MNDLIIVSGDTYDSSFFARLLMHKGRVVVSRCGQLEWGTLISIGPDEYAQVDGYRVDYFTEYPQQSFTRIRVVK